MGGTPKRALTHHEMGDPATVDRLRLPLSNLVVNQGEPLLETTSPTLVPVETTVEDTVEEESGHVDRLRLLPSNLAVNQGEPLVETTSPTEGTCDTLAETAVEDANETV
jgi:hypothetical protein